MGALDDGHGTWYMLHGTKTVPYLKTKPIYNIDAKNSFGK